MNNIPSMIKREAKFRGPTSSQDQNNTIEESFYDLLTLFNSANFIEKRINAIRHVFSIENTFLQLKTQELKNKLDALQLEMEKTDTVFNRKFFIKDFDITADSSIIAASLDTQHQIATIPLSGKSLSKVYLYDDINDKVVFPDSLVITLDPPADNISIIDNDIINAFSNDFNYWFRKVITSTDIIDPCIECIITIDLPDDIISNRDINTINIHPFPVKTVDIMAIEYQLDSNWQSIPGWNGPILESGNIKLYFPQIQAKQVRIRLRQQHWIEEDYKKVFHLGAQEIGIFYTEFKDKLCQFSIECNLKEGGSARVIQNIVAKFNNELALSANIKDLIGFEIYTVQLNGDLVFIKNTLPVAIPDNKIVIKIIMLFDSIAEITPMLESIDVIYSINP